MESCEDIRYVNYWRILVLKIFEDETVTNSQFFLLKQAEFFWTFPTIALVKQLAGAKAKPLAKFLLDQKSLHIRLY